MENSKKVTLYNSVELPDNVKIDKLDEKLLNNLISFYTVLKFGKLAVRKNTLELTPRTFDILSKYVEPTTIKLKYSLNYYSEVQLRMYLDFFIKLGIAEVTENKIKVIDKNFIQNIKDYWKKWIIYLMEGYFAYFDINSEKMIKGWINSNEFNKIHYSHFVNIDMFVFWGLFERAIYKDVVYLKTSELGNYFFFNEEFTFIEEKQITILPNQEILIYSETKPFVLYFLEVFCKKTSEYMFQIDRKKLLKSVSDGNTSDEIIYFFNKYSKNEIPETIKQYFDDINSKTLKIVDDYILIETKNEIITQILLNDKKFKEYSEHIGKNKVLIPKKQEEFFKKELLKMNYALQ